MLTIATLDRSMRQKIFEQINHSQLRKYQGEHIVVKHLLRLYQGEMSNFEQNQYKINCWMSSSSRSDSRTFFIVQIPKLETWKINPKNQNRTRKDLQFAQKEKSIRPIWWFCKTLCRCRKVPRKTDVDENLVSGIKSFSRFFVWILVW